MALSTLSKPRPNPRAELVTITPELAEEWLTKNIVNRKPRDSRVAVYSRDMISGDWMVTGDGPKFDYRGNLINGQHTLMAVVESGQTIRTFVFWDLHPEAQLVMDDGGKRSAADALKFAGYRAASLNILAAQAKIGVLWDDGAFRNSGAANPRRAVTKPEILSWVESNPDSVRSVAAADLYRKSMPPPPSVLAFTHLLFSRISDEDSHEFFARAANLRTEGQGDPIYTMLRRYNSANDKKELLRTPQHLFLLIRTWNAFRLGEPLHVLKVGNTGGSSPSAISIPEPV